MSSISATSSFPPGEIKRDQILGIIPARYASSRFPGKPLADIGGKSMIQRVYEQAKKCGNLHEVVVATDDDRIFDHVTAFGGKAIMTSAEHQSGTDRCAEVASTHPGYGVIINIQGDEPYIDPEQITKLTACFTDPETQIATLIKKVLTNDELFNINSPKVLLNKHAEAIYFSRSAVPHIRGHEQQNWLQHYTYFKHIGIYGYRAEILQQITRLPVSALEKAESLEQLRWVENGYRIKVAETELETHAIDTPEDLLKLDIREQLLPTAMYTPYNLERFQQCAAQLDHTRFAQQQLEIKVGVWFQCVVLKIQKPQWRDPAKTPFGHSIFFSAWVNDDAMSTGKLHYNIHALKMRELPGYTIKSRDFAAAFRSRFSKVQQHWPNVSVSYGPLTLMEGWVQVDDGNFDQELKALAYRFIDLAPMIDEVLRARRK